MFRGTTATHRRLRDRLAALVMVSLLVDLVCGGLAFATECDAKGSDIHS